ncbi:MAG: hypothetical protein RL745_383 [Actinomycetota bacterium]|jgi:hypothetical protein
MAAQSLLESESARQRTSRIKRAGVLALLPLGLFGLPGFLLLTVVPLVASYVQGLSFL